jgi:metacaspase-1
MQLIVSTLPLNAHPLQFSAVRNCTLTRAIVNTTKGKLAMTTRISTAELNRKLTDLDVPEKELAKYFQLDDTEAALFKPVLTLNPETVELPDDPHERAARSEAAMNFANNVARMRRKLRFDRMIADGYSGPVVVSEGDSWFQYPILLEDTIDHLYNMGFAVRSLDAAGDTLQNMLKHKEYVETIEETNASIFLLSAGGNDALGGGNLHAHLRDFDPQLSPAAHLQPSFDALLDHTLAMYERVFLDIEKLPGVVTLCHGYDYVIPNAGKWLGSPMAARGIVDGAMQRELTIEMINRFNTRLSQLVNRFGQRARYVNARGCVGDSLHDWHDELHPKDEGYLQVAQRFQQAILSVGQRSTKANARGMANVAAPAARRGWSLHVGLNVVSLEHYGDEAELFGCHFDAVDMEAIANAQGFEQRTVLFDEQATRDAVMHEISEAAAELQEGDVFLLTYAGHGSQIPDFNRDEDDSADETLCLFDGMLVDDELFALWASFKEGVRVIMISDSCHSGTVTRAARKTVQAEEDPNAFVGNRLLPMSIAARTFRAHREFYKSLSRKQQGPDERLLSRELDMPLRCSVLLLAGCQDNQLSQDGVSNGRFTQELLNVWDEGRFTGDWQRFMKRIVSNMPDNQTPRLTLLGPGAKQLALLPPFTF